MNKLKKYKISLSVLGFSGVFIAVYYLVLILLTGFQWWRLFIFCIGSFLYAIAVGLYPEYMKLEEKREEKYEEETRNKRRAHHY